MGNILIDKMKPEEYNYQEKVNEIKKEMKDLDKSLSANFNQGKSLEFKIENLWNDLEKQIKEVEKNTSKLVYENNKEIKSYIENLKNLELDLKEKILIVNKNGKIRAENIVIKIKEEIKFHIKILYFLIGIDIIIRIFAYI